MDHSSNCMLTQTNTRVNNSYSYHRAYLHSCVYVSPLLHPCCCSLLTTYSFRCSKPCVVHWTYWAYFMTYFFFFVVTTAEMYGVIWGFVSPLSHSLLVHRIRLRTFSGFVRNFRVRISLFTCLSDLLQLLWLVGLHTWPRIVICCGYSHHRISMLFAAR